MFERVFRMHGRVSPLEMLRQIKAHPYGLVVLGEVDRGRIAAKTYEYMGQGKPILYVGPPGELADILEEKGQLVAEQSVASIKTALLRLQRDYLEGQTGKNSTESTDYQEFSFEHLTDQLVRVLEQQHTQNT